MIIILTSCIILSIIGAYGVIRFTFSGKDFNLLEEEEEHHG